MSLGKKISIRNLFLKIHILKMGPKVLKRDFFGNKKAIEGTYLLLLITYFMKIKKKSRKRNICLCQYFSVIFSKFQIKIKLLFFNLFFIEDDHACFQAWSQTFLMRTLKRRPRSLQHCCTLPVNITIIDFLKT